MIFLGPAVAVAQPGETAAAASARIAAASGRAPALILPPGARALAQCLGDVLARMDPAAPLVALTAAQEAAQKAAQKAAPMDWDAEKYRQSLDIARVGPGA